MSDFAQTGLITTLQRLNDTHLAKIERELAVLAHERPIALVLPCHGADLEKPALAHIVAELSEGPHFLREVVVTMNGLDDAGFARAQELFAALPMRRTLLWNDRKPMRSAVGTALRAVRGERSEAAGVSVAPAAPLTASLRSSGGRHGVPSLPAASPQLTGKGGNVDAALRHLTGAGECAIIATQDCDVASFRRCDLARLCYAVAEPRLGFQFAKMYYPRVTDRLYGRVSRLFLAPLLHALLRVAGHQPLLDFLLSFRYPLSGEAAMTRETAAALRLAPGYGLEIGQLCEVFRHLDPRTVCQVDGGAGYDHRHQPATTALAAMAAEIAAELFRQCATEGLPADAAFRAAIATAYRREAGLALHRSARLALINDLPFDETAEREMVATFARQLIVETR